MLNKIFFILLIGGGFCLPFSVSQAAKVFIYMQADNNLADYAYWDLAELSTGLIGSDQEVYIELDLPGDDGYYRIKLFPKYFDLDQDLKYFQSLSLKDFEYELLSQTHELVSQEEVLLNFLIEAQDHGVKGASQLIIWGHGEGFSAGNLPQFGGVALDDYPLSKLTLPKLKNVLDSYESIYNKKFDLILFDACLMQTLEVVYELKDFSHYIIGSTQIQNFKGLPYREYLRLLDTSENTYEMTKALVPMVSKGHPDSKFTMSVVNTQELSEVFLPEFESLLARTSELLRTDLFLRIELLEHLKETNQFLGESRDLNSFLSKMADFLFSRRPMLASEYLDLMQLFGRVLVAYSYGESYLTDPSITLGSFKAFGLWLPVEQDQYILRYADFSESRLFLDFPGWPLWLEQLFSTEVNFL